MTDITISSVTDSHSLILIPSIFRGVMDHLKLDLKRQIQLKSLKCIMSYCIILQVHWTWGRMVILQGGTDTFCIMHNA